MSVLILHPRHIATLAHAFNHWTVPYRGASNEKAWAEKLAIVNFRSAQNYYSLSHALKLSGCCCESEYAKKCVNALHESDSRLYSAVELIKLLDTYDQNAWDCPDYDDADGHRSFIIRQWHVDALRFRLIQQLDGYDAAPAFITDQEVTS